MSARETRAHQDAGFGDRGVVADQAAWGTGVLVLGAPAKGLKPKGVLGKLVFPDSVLSLFQ